MSRNTFTTYRITGYHTQHGEDARATGGVVMLQVRRTRSGWQRRSVDSNGRYRSAGPVEPISEAEGEALFATALQR